MNQFKWVLGVWRCLPYMLFSPQTEVVGVERGGLIRNGAMMLQEEKSIDISAHNVFVSIGAISMMAEQAIAT